MPNPDFTLKVGDTASRLQATLENSGGTVQDLQGATVLWRMAAISANALATLGTATVEQVGDGSGTAGLKGRVHYDWSVLDTAASGLYIGEWQAHYSSGTVQTFPNTGYVLVNITGADE